MARRCGHGLAKESSLDDAEHTGATGARQAGLRGSRRSTGLFPYRGRLQAPTLPSVIEGGQARYRGCPPSAARPTLPHGCRGGCTGAHGRKRIKQVLLHLRLEERRLDVADPLVGDDQRSGTVAEPRLPPRETHRGPVLEALGVEGTGEYPRRTTRNAWRQRKTTSSHNRPPSALAKRAACSAPSSTLMRTHFDDLRPFKVADVHTTAPLASACKIAFRTASDRHEGWFGT